MTHHVRVCAEDDFAKKLEVPFLAGPSMCGSDVRSRWVRGSGLPLQGSCINTARQVPQAKHWYVGAPCEGSPHSFLSVSCIVETSRTSGATEVNGVAIDLAESFYIGDAAGAHHVESLRCGCSLLHL